MILHSVAMGEGAPAVLLHGLFGQALNFATVQKRLAAKHRIVAMDLRNHGASPHAPDMRYTTMAADVLETMAALGLPPCPLIGHSMGGKVTMVASLTAPSRVTRLLVGDIAPVRTRTSFRPFAAAMLAMALPPGLTRAAADAALAAAVPDRVMRGFLLQNLRTGAAPFWKIGLADIAGGLDDIEDWPISAATPYDGPTLFLSGARSDYIRPEHRPLIRALFPKARFVTLNDAGHWLHADDPDGFVSVVSAFLG
ncbi:MAG: alpha/beta fold hydrolase [Rhodospirillales bacterium]|nr:alpha/beta fold hydrolase [Rhodospirillales bacterium]